jgi:hypothetical protein
MGDAVTMTDEDVLAVESIGGTVTSSLKRLLVALEEDVSSSVTHVNTLAVEIRPFHTATATYSHTVVALGALTAVVP